MKTAQIKARGGIRTNVSEERFSPADLASGVNIDLDETGRAARRSGFEQAIAGVFSALWSDEKKCFAVVSGVLNQLNPDFSLTPLKSGVAARVAYGALGESVYWTDGQQAGQILDGASRSWGVAVPGNGFALGETYGDLPAGAYGVTLVYLRGEVESGAPRGQYITLGENSGLDLTNLPVSNDPTVSRKAIYITRPDGEMFYRALVIPNQTTSVVVRGAPPDTLPLRTQFKGPPPAGQLLGFYNGHAYVGSGDTLWYSDPYEYDLFDLRYNFIRMESALTVFAPVDDGVYVATETETMFLLGGGPEDFKKTVVAPYGAVLGTLVYPPNDRVGEKGVQGDAAMWVSHAGVCLGAPSGQFVNLTSRRYVMPAARQGSGLFKLRGGTPQYLATLFS